MEAFKSEHRVFRSSTETNGDAENKYFSEKTMKKKPNAYRNSHE